MRHGPVSAFSELIVIKELVGHNQKVMVGPVIRTVSWEVWSAVEPTSRPPYSLQHDNLKLALSFQ